MNRVVVENPVTGELAVSLDGGESFACVELTDDGTQATELPCRPNDPEWVPAVLVMGQSADFTAWLDEQITEADQWCDGEAVSGFVGPTRVRAKTRFDVFTEVRNRLRATEGGPR